MNLANAAHTGSAFTGGEALKVQLSSNLVARGEFSKIAFGNVDELPEETSPADDDEIPIYDTSEGTLKRVDASDLLPNPEDTVPFAASFRDVFTRTFKSVSLNTALHGEALVSTGNVVPSGAPAGTTAFVVIDIRNESNVSERTALEKIAVGDWLRAKLGDKYIIAKIQHINEDTPNDAFEYWFNPSTQIAETLQYDTLGTGAGEIRFYRQEEGFEVGGGTPEVGDIIRRTSTGWEKYTPSEAGPKGQLVATSADLPAGTAPNTLTWTIESDAPSGFSQGSGRRLNLPNAVPDNVVGLYLELVDGDASDVVVDYSYMLWGFMDSNTVQTETNTSGPLLAADGSNYLSCSIHGFGKNNKSFSIGLAVQNSSNLLEGMYLKVYLWIQEQLTVADLPGVHDVPTATPALADKVLISDEDQLDDPNRSVTIEDILALGGVKEIAEVTNPSVGGSWTDISSDTYDTDDLIQANLIETAGAARYLPIGPVKFGDVSTTYLSNIQKDNTPDLAGQNTDFNPTVVGNMYATGITLPDVTVDSWYTIRMKLGTGNGGVINILFNGYDVGRITARNPGTGSDDRSNTTQTAIQIFGQQKVVYFGRTSTNQLLIGWNTSSDVRAEPLQIYQLYEYAELRIRRSSSKLQYRLTGDVNSSCVLRVQKYG